MQTAEKNQSLSVAEGVTKWLESDIKNKKTTRLTNFDISRDLPESEPPEQEPSLNKTEQSRWFLLQKWKEEKQKKKLEAIKKRKIPFVVGIPKKSKNYELPPTIIWPLLSTSGRVTRSQAARSNNMSNNKTEEENALAPQNASFNPSLEGLYKPTLSTYEEKKYKTHKKESTKVMSPNNDIILNQQPRCLHSKSKLNGQTTVKKTQNELNTQKKNQTYIPKNKTLAKQPLQDQSSIMSISTSSSSSSDSNTCTEETVIELEVTNIKNIKTSKKEDHSKSTTSANIVDLSKCRMETNDDKRSHSSEMLADATVTPNKQNDNKRHFLTSTPKNVPKSESSSEEKRKLEKIFSPQATDVPMTPRQINEEVKKISPCVNLSRGKENTRKKIKKRIDEGLLDEDVRDMRVELFQKQLDSDIKQMTETCEVWDKILEQSILPDEFQEAALAAVEQARQLMSRTLQQFASLLRRCERPEPGTALVSLADVLGFREMAFLQLKDVDGRFKMLELSRARDWTGEGPLDVTRRPKQAERTRPAPKQRLKSNTVSGSAFRAAPVKSAAASTRRRKRAQLWSVLYTKVMKVSKKAKRANFLHKVEKNLITTDTWSRNRKQSLF